jgi:hypothetical protein
MKIDVSDRNLGQVNKIVNLLTRSFPENDIGVQQKEGKYVIKINEKKPPEEDEDGEEDVDFEHEEEEDVRIVRARLRRMTGGD